MRRTIGQVFLDNGKIDTIYMKGSACLVTTEIKCDRCGRKRSDCTPVKDVWICQGCIDEQKQARKLIIRAKTEKLYTKLGGRLDVKI